MAEKPADLEHRRTQGFTLIELTIVISIISVLCALGLFAGQTYSYKAQIAAAVTDVRNVEKAIYTYNSEKGIFPPTLADVGMADLRDPWKNPYVYWPITGDPKQKTRKDRNLHPLNTDFDLFSIGRDGATALTLTSHASQDDIIRANNGGFVGPASSY